MFLYLTFLVPKVIAINEAAKDWGLQCLRYEIRDISPPRGVKAAMEMQAEAERKKRAQILESEGERQAHINIADGKKSSMMLEAQGEAEAILARAQATNKGIALVSQALKENGGVEAASLRVAEQYINAFGNVAKESTTLLLPMSASNPASMMAQALNIYKSLIGQDPAKTALPDSHTPQPQPQSSQIARRPTPALFFPFKTKERTDQFTLL
ncbi:putative Band 7 domain, Stomatin/HflK/HflC family, Band 7 extension, Band 7/SPFH domain superfamily [Helianthus annuus]|nr:putative Band 7 domain, Stomatin/HflK/HflC family, Band 7 extension, Band 7/SPFH domain superfamily [Helianthus annuus]